jgi:hypothetical protein
VFLHGTGIGHALNAESQRLERLIEFPDWRKPSKSLHSAPQLEA